ncbi:MAG: DNA mismatch repair protein MutS, partial [Elusimicrobia bacterium]|nr:DNA mismatch repair protein MutS [Elusimicrobiota bacterium]
VGAVLFYVGKNEPNALSHIKPPRQYRMDEFLALDDRAIDHLDLLRRGTPCLLDVLDHTVTPMGGRKLKWWLLHPLRNLEAIRHRQNCVDYFLELGAQRKEMVEILRNSADIERILGRLTAGNASGRDMGALRRTLRLVPPLKDLFHAKPLLPDQPHPLKPILENLQPSDELTALLETSLADDPPLKIADGGIIRDGFSPELDELRDSAKNGRDWISRREAEERDRTGIGSLKIGYTSVFGYYLEVSRANLSKVPAEWIRKQTLANAERYITPELKAQEDKILGAEEKAKALEAELFARVRSEVLKHREPLRGLSDALSRLDTLASLAEAAEKGRYVRPVMTDKSTLFIEKGRHPVVERALASTDASTPFVPNDVLIDGWENQILLVTGPNMAGKSTYLRQAALLAIMAQMGSFIPAESAEMGILDRIFTRIGAGDNLAGGASTFLVEMQEVSNILHNATQRSLVVLDEVGRGTSTYDGMAVAWAVIEHLHRKEGQMGPKVLFATHYFELTELARQKPGVKNHHAAVREWTLPDGRTELVFLHQVLPGPADRSYGVHVAEMAGLPSDCVARARSILEALERRPQAGQPPDDQKPSEEPGGSAPTNQLDFFSHHPILEELKQIDPNSLTPLEALQKLSLLVQQARGKEGRISETRGNSE